MIRHPCIICIVGEVRAKDCRANRDLPVAVLHALSQPTPFIQTPHLVGSFCCIRTFNKWSCLRYEFALDVPGVTTPEQFAGEVVVVPQTAGRPLICRGEKELVW